LAVFQRGDFQKDKDKRYCSVAARVEGESGRGWAVGERKGEINSSWQGSREAISRKIKMSGIAALQQGWKVSREGGGQWGKGRGR